MIVRSTLWPLAAAFLLASCSASSEFLEPTAIDLDGPDEASLLPCEPAQSAPDDLAALNAGEQGALWEADRINLANCGAQHWVLIQWAEGVLAAFAPDQGAHQSAR